MNIMNIIYKKLNFHNMENIKNDNNITNNHKHDFNLIQSYLTAIDNKNKKKIKELYYKNIKNNIEKDIVYELYKKKEIEF